MEEAFHYLMNDINIKYGDSVVVGVSGGPDSMALLHLMIRVKKALDIEIICAHVNHNTGRKGQYEEQKFVEKYCKTHNVVFETMIINDYGDDNFHNEAHGKRYNFFGNLVKQYNAKYLFTAHHGDDLMETIIMRIVRGSTLRGYSGFSKIVDKGSYKIVRPLIELTKEDILEYNKENKIEYAIDSSNLKDDYTRNRYRKYVIPQIKKEEKNAHKKFYKFSKSLLEYNDYIEKIVKEKTKKVYVNDVLNIEEFVKEEKIIQMKIIYSILEHIYQDDLMMVSDKHAEILYEAINSKKANLKVHLPNNVEAIKNYETLVLAQLHQNPKTYDIELNKFINLPNGKNIELVEEFDSNSNFVCRLNSSEIKLPLHVRTRNDGDKISIKGMIGHKKINDIFINEKISMKEREEWPIVIDSMGIIVWLPGLKKTKFDKTKEENYDIILRYY
ncbi:MAG: tRNA lysidine(34) synthetase TilS [Bacilli bacterium]